MRSMSHNFISASPHKFRLFGLLLSLALLYSTVTTHAASKADLKLSEQSHKKDSEHWQEQWQSVYMAGEKIGHRHIVRSHGKTLSTDEYLTILTKVPGASATKSEIHMHYEEDATGKPLLLQKSLQSKHIQRDWIARVKKQKLIFERWQGKKGKSKKHTQTFKLPEDFLLREGLRNALLQKSQDQHTVFDFEYSTWNFSLGDFERIRLQLKPYSKIDTPTVVWLMTRHVLNDGKPNPKHSNEDTGNNSDKPDRYYLDSQFVSIEEYSQVSGQDFSIITCDKDCALKNSHALENVYSNLIRSPYRIPDSALSGKIRYQVNLAEAIALPNSAEQHAKKVALHNADQHRYQIDVCAHCDKKEAEAPSKTELAQALKSNYWMSYETKAFQSALRSALGKKHRPPTSVAETEKTLRKLMRFVQKRMPMSRIDYAGYSNATEALASGAGDCTEHALLLATLSRAAGIPTRVVFGIAYNNERFYGRRNVFVPHAWVQVWNGERWQSFDSGLEGFTAGHIALKISDGDQHDFVEVTKALAGFSIQSAAQVRKK